MRQAYDYWQDQPGNQTKQHFQNMLVETLPSLINNGNIRIPFNSTLHFSHIKMQLSIQPQFQYPQQRLLHLSHITTMPASPHSVAPHPPHFQFSPANSHFKDHLRSGGPWGHYTKKLRQTCLLQHSSGCWKIIVFRPPRSK